MTDQTLVTLTDTQKAQLSTHIQSRNYAAGYRLVLSILPPTGNESLMRTRYWLTEAANINENNPTSAANVFIRAYTKTGLDISFKDSSDANLQATSDLIADTVLKEMFRNGAVAPVSNFLHHDIERAITTGGQSIGGWAGAAFFWNEPYRNPATQTMTTVGALIQSSQSEMSKFIQASAAGFAAVVQKLDLDGNLTAGELSRSALGEIWRSWDLIPVKTKIEIFQGTTNQLGGALGQQFLDGLNFPQRLIEDMQRGIRQMYVPVSESTSPNPAEQIAALLPQGIVIADANNGGGYGTMPDLVAQRATIGDWVNDIGAGNEATLVELGNGAIAVVAGGEVVGVAQREGFQLALNHGGIRKVIDANGTALSTTRHQIFDDGSTLDIITDHVTGREYVKATDALSATREANLPASTQPQALTDDLYAGSATFLNALRSGDKLGQLLAMGQMVSSYARLNNNNTAQFDSFLGDVSGVVGVIGALQGLRSADPLTQLNAAGNLLRGANYFAARMGATTESVVNGYTEGAQGFLNTDTLHLLSQFGAVLSIANLMNLGQMLENGQVGSAIGATVGAVNGAAFLTGAGGATSAAGTGAFIPMDPTTLVIFIVAMAVLDEIFSEDPPPPPPVGQATFRTLADGTLSYELAHTAHGGEAILAAKLDAIVAKLNAQLAYANGRPLTEAQSTLLELTPGQIAALGQRPVLSDRDALALVASRMPKITLQSWPAYDPDNGVNNFFFILDNQHPQTGQSFMSGIARQDLVRHFAESLVYPQAIVSGWEVQHLTAKFGVNEADWKTEGQWASALSAVEVQRSLLQVAYTNADTALKAAQQNQLVFGAWVADGDITGNVHQGTPASAAALQAAQTTFDAAKASLVAYEARNPFNPQAAAHIVDPALTDPVALQAAREGAARQWLTVIALDMGADGITRKALPATVRHDLVTLGLAGPNAGAPDGVTRFDADNDGYREATEWIAPSEGILGIDRDGNGALGSANELFNGINTPFDQRGWRCQRVQAANRARATRRRHHRGHLQGRCVVQRFGYEGDPVGRGRGTCRVCCTVSYY